MVFGMLRGPEVKVRERDRELVEMRWIMRMEGGAVGYRVWIVDTAITRCSVVQKTMLCRAVERQRELERKT